MNDKFISCSALHFIYNMQTFLDIEFSQNLEYILNSNKSLILWNPYSDEVLLELWKCFRYKNMPSYFVERGALPDTIFVDKNGFLSDSSSYNEENWNKPLTHKQDNEIIDYMNQLKEDLSSLEYQTAGRMSKEEFIHKLDLPSDKKLIFVPLQLEGDTVIRYWSDWVNNVKGFQKIIMDLSKMNRDKIFLIKNHPLTTRERMVPHENIKVVDTFHYKDCITYSDYLITINSGIGLQAMAWLKPVIIVGKAFYNFDEINIKANNLDELHCSLQKSVTVNFDKVKRFIYFLKFIFYSDCQLIKTEQSRFKNVTDDSRYINLRIFKI
jgi:hypothetical protein